MSSGTFGGTQVEGNLHCQPGRRLLSRQSQLPNSILKLLQLLLFSALPSVCTHTGSHRGSSPLDGQAQASLIPCRSSTGGEWEHSGLLDGPGTGTDVLWAGWCPVLSVSLLQSAPSVCYSCPWSCPSTRVQLIQPKPSFQVELSQQLEVLFHADHLSVPTVLVSQAFILQVWGLFCSSALFLGWRGQSPWVVLWGGVAGNVDLACLG